MKIKTYIKDLRAVILGLAVIVGAGYVSAWTGPTAAAPNGNVAAPINVGSGSQYKIGTLTLADLIVANLRVTNPDGTTDNIPDGYVLVASGADTGRVKWVAPSTLNVTNITNTGYTNQKTFNFSANGSQAMFDNLPFTYATTWEVPTSTTKIRIHAWGGGGGGAYYAGSGGGVAGNVINSEVTVTPHQILTVTVGRGGGGGHDSVIAGPCQSDINNGARIGQGGGGSSVVGTGVSFSTYGGGAGGNPVCSGTMTGSGDSAAPSGTFPGGTGGVPNSPGTAPGGGGGSGTSGGLDGSNGGNGRVIIEW